MHFSKRIDLQIKEARGSGDIASYIKARELRIEKCPFDKYRMKLIAGLLSENLGQTLEIGSNIGFLAKYYKRISTQVFLCDIDDFVIQAAKKFNSTNMNNSKMQFICADICNLPLKDNHFDTILALEILEHIPVARHEKALQELLRVAKDGVVFYVSTPNRFSFAGLEGKILELLKKGYKWNAWDPDHFYVYSSGEFIEFINKHKLNIERIIGFHFLPGSFLIRLPLMIQDLLGYISFTFTKYFGIFFPFNRMGFSIIIKFRKK